MGALDSRLVALWPLSQKNAEHSRNHARRKHVQADEQGEIKPGR
jgi:hypothetical protein